MRRLVVVRRKAHDLEMSENVEMGALGAVKWAKPLIDWSRCVSYLTEDKRRFQCGRPAGHAGLHVAYKPGTAEVLTRWFN